MTDQDNLRNRIAAKILDNFNPPDDKHPSWWINPEVSAQAIIDELGLQVLEVDRIDLINGTVASYQIVGEWDN